MPRKRDEDLFRESTMTFGEHLEELRSCLFKALLWLIAGFLIGLTCASTVVGWIQIPLEKALEEHYKGFAVRRVEEQLQQLKAKGLPLPGSPHQLAELVEAEDLLPEQVFLEPVELMQQLRLIYENVRNERDKALDAFQGAAPLLEGLDPPADGRKKKLSQKELDQLARAVELLVPVKLLKKDLTQEDLDGVAKAIRKGKTLGKDELALVREAMAGQEQRYRDDRARLAEGVDLLDRTRFPAREPHQKLHRDDLARVFVWRPIEDDRRIQARALNPQEAFMIFIKGALLVGVLIASPGIFHQIWSFVAAGLYYHERRFVYVFGPFSLALFLAGAALVFFFVFQMVLRFLFTFNDWLGISIEPRISEWLSFVLILPLGFGIAFQLPLVMLFLERIGVFDIAAYLAKWRIAILVIFVLSMLLTPADPGSMLLMAVPLTLLYFGGILLCRFMPRSRSPYDEETKD